MYLHLGISLQGLRWQSPHNNPIGIVYYYDHQKSDA